MKIIEFSNDSNFPKLFQRTNALILALVLVVISLGALPEASANQKLTYSIGDVGPSGGYIAHVDEYDDYEWDYIEVSPPKWSTPAYGFGAIRMLPHGKNAESLTNLPWTVGSGLGNTEKIINTLGRGWEIERVSKNASDCVASNCKVTVELKTPHGAQSFPTGIDTPILPIMCSGKLITTIVNTGDLTVLGPKSFSFYDNVATRNIVSDVNSNSGCKITYLALAADEANIGGTTDWFLPSLDEMSLIQKSLMTKKNVFDLYGDAYAASNFKNETTVYMWGFNYKSDSARVGARLLVDIKYSYEPIFARTFKTTQPVLSKSFPKNCPSTWNPNLLVDVKKLESGTAAGLITGASEKDKFEIVSSWVVQKSKDGKTYQDTSVSGKLGAENAQSLVSTRMQGIAENGSFFRYSINIERKDCPKAVLFSNSANLRYTDTVAWRTGNIDTYIKDRPSLFPTFKESEQLKKSITEIRDWFTSFNTGTKSACFLPDGTYGVHIFPEGHLFGCEGDLSKNQPYEISTKIVSYDAQKLRVAPFDVTSCEIDVDNRMASPGSPIVFIDWFGKPRGIGSYFVNSRTTCVIGIFLYDSWGWQWLESISLNDKSISVKEKQRVAEVKAAAELKIRQEAEAKAAAELKAKQDAEAKIATELKAKQEAEAKAAAELKARQEAEAKAIAEAKAAAELKAKQEAEAIKILVDAKAQAAAILAAAQAKAKATSKITITCIKGKLTKKITAVKPLCPAGYKKK